MRAFAAGTHPFLYPDQMDWPLPQKEELCEHIDWADCITIGQSHLPKDLWKDVDGRFTGIEWLERMKPKPIVMTHGGSFYRADPDLFAEVYLPYVEATICFEADLMGWFKNEHLVLPPVELKWFQPRKRFGGMTVGHFPSNPDNKGTEQIVPVLQKYKHKISTKQVAWPRQLDRGADCDVIVDQIEPRIGEWVTWSSEIAALGCIPIANSHNPQPYVETYGRMPGIHICNTLFEMEVELDRINGLSRKELDNEGKEARRWIEQCHTKEVTGRILMDQVFGPLL